MSTDLSCQKTRSQFTRHLSLSARPRSTGGVGRHSQRHGEAVLPKRPGEALQTHPNHKCKIKGNSSKSRLEGVESNIQAIGREKLPARNNISSKVSFRYEEKIYRERVLMLVGSATLAFSVLEEFVPWLILPS